MELDLENIMNGYYRPTMFQPTEEFERWASGAFSGSNRTIVSERNRRKKHGDKLLALRQAVPKISKMDRASIIKDAINYIQALQQEEASIEAEIMELESLKLKEPSAGSGSEQELPVLLRTKRNRMTQTHDYGYFQTPPIQVLQFKTAYIREKTVLVSLVCTRRSNTILILSELFESLRLKISASNITIVAERVLKTVFIEADEEDEESLKEKIQKAIAETNNLETPVLM